MTDYVSPRDLFEPLRMELEALSAATSGATYGGERRRQLIEQAIVIIGLWSERRLLYRQPASLIDLLKPVLVYKERLKIERHLSDIEEASMGVDGSSTPEEKITGIAAVSSIKREPSALSAEKPVMPAILILVAARVEYETAIELAGVREELRLRRRAVGAHIFVDLGFKYCPVWLFQCKKGSVGPGAATTRTMEALMSLVPRPYGVIVSGIAFGMRQGEQRIGDVIVGEQVRLYEAERRGTTRRLSRGDRPSTSEILLDWFRSSESDWCWGQQIGQKPKIHTGLVMSGEKLADDPEFIGELRELEPEAIGGEMEAAGVYSAAYSRNTNWAVVKGICDWGMGKGDKYQEVAARNALDFVFHTLDQPVIVEALREYMEGRDNGKQPR